MKTRFVALLVVLLALSSALTGTTLAQAPEPQSVTQPGEAPPSPGLFDPRTCTPELGHQRGTAPGLQMLSEGHWFMPEDASGHAAQSTPQATGGPDEYGYRWDDAVPFAWTDVTWGTDTGLGGATSVVGPIALPFTFKFYEKTYDQIYISKHGYAGFTNVYMNRAQSRIPDPGTPNNVIAPYWVPALVNESGYGGRVYIASGGSAPNRYFIIEWHQIRGDYLPDQNVYTFEVILHENGDIVVQYATMTYGNSWVCGQTGIEDSEGLDGLGYGSFCQKYASNKAVRFYRPPPAVRVQARPAYQGRFVRAGETASFQQRVINTGEFGADTYDLTPNSAWPVALYAGDGVTPLTDTNGNGVIDTGPIAQGGSGTFTAKIQTPAGGLVGDDNAAAVTIRSSRNAAVQKQATFQTAIPAPFAQGFRDNVDYAQTFYIVQPGMQSTNRVSNNGYDTAVAAMPNRNFVYAMRNWLQQDSARGYVLYYTLLNRIGQVNRATSQLSELAGGGVYTYDYSPAVAAAPDGRIGVLWYRELYNPTDSNYNYNVYFAILDKSGDIMVPPTNLTNNPRWGFG